MKYNNHNNVTLSFCFYPFFNFYCWYLFSLWFLLIVLHVFLACAALCKFVGNSSVYIKLIMIINEAEAEKQRKFQSGVLVGVRLKHTHTHTMLQCLFFVLLQLNPLLALLLHFDESAVSAQ